MSSEILLTIEVRDSEGNLRIVRGVKQSFENDFLEDIGTRHHVNHFLRLDDGRVVERTEEKTLQAVDDKETFKIVRIIG